MTHGRMRVAIGLIVMMIVAAGAFAGGATETTPSGAGTPAELRVFLRTARPENEYTDEVKDWVEENMGIRLDYTRVPADAWQQKLTLALASADVYDIMHIPDPAFYYQYARQGAFYDITDEFGDYPNLGAYATELSLKRLTVDERLYGAPALNVEGKWNLYMRSDWLENVNLDVPETLDELTEVMRAFTEDDPDGDGRNNTYGYGGIGAWGAGHELMPFLGAFGVVPGYYSQSGNRVITHSISREYKQALMYIRDLVAQGYVHPEVFIMDGNQAVQQFVNGVTGSMTAWWSEAGVWFRDLDFEGLNPTGEVTQIKPPVGPNGSSGMVARNDLDAVISLHADTENAEAALDFLEWGASEYGYRTLKYGLEGVNWTMENGRLSYLYLFNDWKDLQGRSNTYDEAFSLFQRMDIYPEQIIENPRFYNGFLQASFENPLIRNLFIGLVTDEYARLNADVEALEREMRIRYIMGEASFDDWDREYVARWKAIGGETVRQSLLGAYNAQYGTNLAYRE